MPYIMSVGISTPENRITQVDAKELVREIFPRTGLKLERLLPVFDHAIIEERQFVVPVDWFKEEHTFAERNELYVQNAIFHSKAAIKNCLQNEKFLKNKVKPEDIDCILFVSSTGISTPTIDAYIINELSFSSDIVRIPIWGLGCAGGASGLSRASDWLKAYPDKAALLVNLEFCSLAFQVHDNRKSNFIGSALFGDGISCTLIVGENSPLIGSGMDVIPNIKSTSSRMKKDTLSVMGWDIKNSGFHVIFSKNIPLLVNIFWEQHLNDFISSVGIAKEDLSFFTAHPGGTKVLEAMQEVLACSKNDFRFSYDVLKKHGNMSSPTVIYVLREAMLTKPNSGTKSLLTALGPGFSSEMMLLEWDEL